MPTSSSSRVARIVWTIEACVSPYVYGRGCASAWPTSPASVWTRTSTLSAVVTVPDANPAGRRYGTANGIASSAVIRTSARPAPSAPAGIPRLGCQTVTLSSALAVEEAHVAVADHVRDGPAVEVVLGHALLGEALERVGL